MTKYLHRISILTFFILIFLNGCQQEVVEIINPPSDQVITPNSAVADLVERTTLKDGSQDNVLDHTSCISLVLPVTVRIDGKEIVVYNEDDLKMIENLLKELEEENEDVDLIFPVNVILADYTEITIHNKDELETLQDQCHEAGEDDDIECVDFKYPITCSIYDTENQLSDVLTVNNDKDLHDLFDYFDDDKICSFEFPITLVLSGGEEVVIQNNDELEAVLKSAGSECDEEDDHYEDHSGSDDHSGEDNPFISSIIVEGLWIVAEYTQDDVNKTQNYDGFHLDFNTDGNVIAVKGTDEVNGTWSVITDSGVDYLVLDFSTMVPFDEFNEDWEIFEFSETKLELRNVSGGDGSISKLVFERK
jgi:uncharacterized protein (UPF0216 family)